MDSLCKLCFYRYQPLVQFQMMGAIKVQIKVVGGMILYFEIYFYTLLGDAFKTSVNGL